MHFKTRKHIMVHHTLHQIVQIVHNSEVCIVLVMCTAPCYHLSAENTKQLQKHFIVADLSLCIAAFGSPVQYILADEWIVQSTFQWIVHLFRWIVHLVAVDAKSAGNPTFPFAPGLGRICRVGGTSLLCSISWCQPEWHCASQSIPMPATPWSCALLLSPPLPISRLRFCPRAGAWQDMPAGHTAPSHCWHVYTLVQAGCQQCRVPTGLATPLLAAPTRHSLIG